MFNDFFDLDVEIGIKASLYGELNGKTDNLVTVPHLNKDVYVSVPNNIQVGQKIRIKEMGKKGINKKGDFLVRIDDIDIYEPMEVCLDKIDGTVTKVNHFFPQIKRNLIVNIPNDAKEGDKIRLRGAGVPKNETEKGDIYIVLTKIERNFSSESKECNHDDSKQLEKLIGLTNIKKEINALISFVKVQSMRQQRGMSSVPLSLHCVFTGNPGTGKTTVARILANEYKKMGVLKKGHTVEVDRSGLVGQYIGETAIKTQEKIHEAMGGVLFIDEAYALAKADNSRDFGQEAIDTLLKAMEDYRNEFIVIVAGYEKQMEKFINSNPGLKSRFSRIIKFEDYSAEEMIQIFLKLCSEYQYTLSRDAYICLERKMNELELNKPENFANAREVRNIFERVIQNQAVRVSKGKGDLGLIKSADFEE
ncbi:AAA family ATPase [Frisingicoccus sp.]|uniref:AAA family ATPase n=1 Tax=Frisingicoccus sp. TaxID=1918627 RepID=UPI003AB8F5B6